MGFAIVPSGFDLCIYVMKSGLAQSFQRMVRFGGLGEAGLGRGGLCRGVCRGVQKVGCVSVEVVCTAMGVTETDESFRPRPFSGPLM